MVAVVEVSIDGNMHCSKRGGADYGLQGYGFVGIADCVRSSGRYGLQDYGLFYGPLKFVSAQFLWEYTCFELVENSFLENRRLLTELHLFFQTHRKTFLGELQTLFCLQCEVLLTSGIRNYHY